MLSAGRWNSHLSSGGGGWTRCPPDTSELPTLSVWPPGGGGTRPSHPPSGKVPPRNHHCASPGWWAGSLWCGISLFKFQGGLPSGQFIPEAAAAGLSFGEVSNSSIRLAPLEQSARNISKTAFSLAGVPAGGAHFKVCEGRKGQLGSICGCGWAFGAAKGTRTVSHSMFSFRHEGKGQSGLAAARAGRVVPQGCLGSPLGRLKKSLCLGATLRHLCVSEGTGPSTLGAAQTTGCFSVSEGSGSSPLAVPTTQAGAATANCLQTPGPLLQCLVRLDNETTGPSVFWPHR